MIFKKGKNKKPKAEPTIITEELDDLPYAGVFDLPREEEKLRAVYEHEQGGGGFDIRKIFSSGRFKGRTIAAVDHFLTYFEVEEMVEEQYGGGTYNVHPAGSPPSIPPTKRPTGFFNPTTAAA